MSREQYLKQCYLCSGLGLALPLAAIVAHSIERFAKVDIDLGFALLWVAVFMFIQGYFQPLQSLRVDSSQPQTFRWTSKIKLFGLRANNKTAS